MASTSHIKTSINPTFINLDDVAFIPIRGISHKLFFNVAHNSSKHFIGGGSSVEFGRNGLPKIPDTESFEPFFDSAKTRCITSSLSQWALWIKGGVLF